MIIQDRFDAGSGHGWSGAHSVVWNTVAHAGMIVQKPPVGHNFLSKLSMSRASKSSLTYISFSRQLIQTSQSSYATTSMGLGRTS